MSTNISSYLGNDNIVPVIQRTFIKMCGLDTESKRPILWLSRVALVCFVVCLVAQLIAIFMALDDTDQLFECFSIFTFCGMGALKLLSMRSNHEQWSALLLELGTLETEQLTFEFSEDYQYDKEDKKYFLTNIRAYTVNFHYLKTTLRRVYVVTCIIFLMTPFIECFYWKLSSNELRYPHVLPVWSPAENISFWGYFFTVIVEIIAACYTVVIHFSFDIMVFGLMIFLTGQFGLLRDLSENIAGTDSGYDSSPQRDEQAHFRIKKCHRVLKILDSAMFKLDKLVQNILGQYFLIAVLTLCSVALRLSSEEMTVMKIISLLQYVGACLTQLFLFCYYGDIVMQKSRVGAGEGAYACAWWRLSPRMRREVMLLGAWQARVRRLQAGPFNTLNLPSFIQIVRAAYSYYAVLRKKQ